MLELSTYCGGFCLFYGSDYPRRLVYFSNFIVAGQFRVNLLGSCAPLRIRVRFLESLLRRVSESSPRSGGHGVGI